MRGFKCSTKHILKPACSWMSDHAAGQSKPEEGCGFESMLGQG